jgi:hypothetical protein
MKVPAFIWSDIRLSALVEIGTAEKGHEARV